MTEQDQPALEPKPGGPNPALEPSHAPSLDRSGWAQPPAPQSPGPPGAFVDRPAPMPGSPLPPGAGSPVAPGPPMSVRPPIGDNVFNLGGLGLLAAIVLVVIIVVAVLIAALHH
jgi:hypothetical protein